MIFFSKKCCAIFHYIFMKCQGIKVYFPIRKKIVQKYDQNQIYKNAILGTVVKLQIEKNAHKNAHRKFFFGPKYPLDQKIQLREVA